MCDSDDDDSGNECFYLYDVWTDPDSGEQIAYHVTDKMIGFLFLLSVSVFLSFPFLFPSCLVFFSLSLSLSSFCF
jgi:hypothetical protein